MTKVDIIEAKLSHAEMLAPDMRAVDVAEVRATYNVEPLEALRASVKAASFASTCFINDEPICMFGVSPVKVIDGTGKTLENVGAPWMLATNGFYRYVKSFISYNGKYIEKMLELYPILMNYVDERNIAAKRWLKRAGFTIYAPEPWGVLNMPFHRFEKRREGF